MTRFRSLSDLSPGMQRGLIRCHTLIVEVSDERHCGIAPRTLAALTRHELIEQATDSRLRKVYRPTPKGWELLRQEEPLFLHRRAHRGYTSREEMALREEQVVDATGRRRAVPVEAVHPTVLEDYVKQAHERDAARRAGVDDDLLSEQRSAEKRLRELQRLAGERSVQARDDLRVAQRHMQALHRRLDAIEARIREQTQRRAA